MPYADPERQRAYCRQRHAANKAELEKAKDLPCADCGVRHPHYVMEFDHVPVRGKKKSGVAQIAGSRKITSKTMQEELSKCDLVCANCHKVRTYFRYIFSD